MFTLTPTNQFKKDARKITKRASKNLFLIEDFFEKLKTKGAIGIERKYLPHHIKPDLLIIWSK